MTEPLCSHGHPAKHCTCAAHTVWRFCPKHLVGWSALRESSCWWVEDDGKPCQAEPKLGEPPRPSAIPETAVVMISKDQQAEASWVLDERVEQEVV